MIRKPAENHKLSEKGYLRILVARRELRGAIVLLLLLSLIPIDIGRYDALLGPIADAGHFWFYLVLSWAIGRIEKKYALRVALFLSLTSAIIEIVQPYFGRDQNIYDFLSSSAGALTGYLIVSRRIIAAGVFCAALGALLFIPVVTRYRVLNFQERDFPVLLNTSNPLWQELWDVSAPNSDKPTAKLELYKNALAVRPLKGGFYPGVVYRNWELPWTGYSAIELDIYSPVSQPLQIRIDDDKDCIEYGSRFNKRLDLRAGRQLVEIPLSEIEHAPKDRLLDLTRIKRVMLFRGNDSTPQFFILFGMRLK